MSGVRHSNMNAGDQIQTERQSICPVCKTPGVVKYVDLTDRLFGAPGSWSLKECPSPACGALWLDPRPTLADIGRLYSNYYTHNDANRRGFVSQAVRWFAREIGAAHYGFNSSRYPWPGKYLASLTAALYPGLRDHIDLLLRYLPASSMGTGKLLDVGCGNGEALEILGDLGWQVSGVEIDPQAVAAARRRNLDVRQGTLADASFSDGSFDAVTSSHVVEHVHDPTAFLVQSRRVLRVGGSLIAVTPNARSRSHLKFGANWLDLDPPRHLVLFTPESLRATAEKAGLRNVRVTTTARAVALSEIAGPRIRDAGYFKEAEWPGFPVWFLAKTRQAIETLRTKPTDIQGNELVLIATR